MTTQFTQEQAIALFNSTRRVAVTGPDGKVFQAVVLEESIEYFHPSGALMYLPHGSALRELPCDDVYGIFGIHADEFYAQFTVLPFINLTPHSVGVLGTDGETVVEVPPCGQLARVDYTDSVADVVIGESYYNNDYVDAPEFSAVVRQYGEVTGLPPEGSPCVVSMPVAERCAGRDGVYYPDSGRDCIRDATGQIKAVRRLVKAGAKKAAQSLDIDQIEELAIKAGFDVDDGEVLSGRAGSLQRFAKLIEEAIRA